MINSKKTYISIQEANLHNLKKLSVDLLREGLVVVTGLSGSGKSSLVFDTLFAEGQRRYTESLSTYARQFLGRMQKPPVKAIEGISPAIAIHQRRRMHNARATVGTLTEIHDYLRLLYARCGTTYSPISGQEVRKDTVQDVLAAIEKFKEGERYYITFPFKASSEVSLTDRLRITLQKGYTRLMCGEDILFIEDIEERQVETWQEEKLRVLVLRGRKGAEIAEQSLVDAIEQAFFEGAGYCLLVTSSREITFSKHFERDGKRFLEPTPHLFSFNSPQGACKRCEGLGSTLDIDIKKVIPDDTLSVYEGAVAPFRLSIGKKWLEPLLTTQSTKNFPLHTPYSSLSERDKEVLWHGEGPYKGIHEFFSGLEAKSHQIQYRVLLSRYRGKVQCPSCKGSRLRKEATYVRVGDRTLSELFEKPVSELLPLFESLTLPKELEALSKSLLSEICMRLRYLKQVGLEYLTLARAGNTLSGGEYQRIQLATALGRPLVDAMYILDEPTIGLHAKDIDNLIHVLEALRDGGNPVIVVEHEERVIRAADQVVEIGPAAGNYGGELVFTGPPTALTQASVTGKYLHSQKRPSLKKHYRQPTGHIYLKNVQIHNLKNIEVAIPLGVLTVLTGVSGSGKSTLVEQALLPGLEEALRIQSDYRTSLYHISGDHQAIDRIECMDQHPIGRSSRSNLVTYLKIYDDIRSLFAKTVAAKRAGLRSTHFSFNSEGGRCEVCKGEGKITIEMQFMADVELVCDTCKGQRFGAEVLSITYKDKRMDEVLNMTVTEAITFFSDHTICNKLAVLEEVGLGYVRLGQSSSTLSGGEAQRMKLASFLAKKHVHAAPTFFVFDEPTTGLHMHDVKQFMLSVHALIEMGHSVLIVEHNMDVIRSADWILDLGPGGGDQGGRLCFSGSVEALCKLKKNHTATYLSATTHT